MLLCPKEMLGKNIPHLIENPSDVTPIHLILFLICIIQIIITIIHIFIILLTV